MKTKLMIPDFNPYSDFPEYEDLGIFTDKSVRFLIDKLYETKQAPCDLSKKEQSDRDKITFALFRAIETKQTTIGQFEEIRRVLPSRYQRAFVQLLIETGFGLKPCGDKGFTYIYHILRSCDQMGCLREKEAIQNKYLKKIKMVV